MGEGLQKDSCINRTDGGHYLALTDNNQPAPEALYILTTGTENDPDMLISKATKKKQLFQLKCQIDRYCTLG